jgi:hypothetical protein
MGKRSSKDADAGAKGSAKKVKPVGLSTVLRPVLFGAAILSILGAVLPKVL